jgi:prepilin-type N-terminal cleavage/methylation domain-containing protein
MKITNCKLKIANRQGFTLIELLVVIAIIGILAGTAIVNFGKNEDRDVRAEKDRFTSFLREVQNKSLAGERLGIATDGMKVCGFGVSQKSATQLEVYYISTSNLDDDCTSLDNRYSDVDPCHDFESFNLTNGVEIDGAFPDIFFLSPNGEVFEDGVSLSGTDEVDISLAKGSTVLSDIISINASGRIY